MQLISIFVRKEPTSDPVSIALGFGKQMDTIAYRDRACTQRMARWTWDRSGCPDRRFKTAMLNCYRWKLEWLDPLKGAAQ